MTKSKFFAVYDIDENGSESEYDLVELCSVDRDRLISFMSLTDFRGLFIDKEVISKFPPISLAKLEGHLGRYIRHAKEFLTLGYCIHDGRELALMLAGEKPFAMFGVLKGGALSEVTEQNFSKFVDQGVLIERRVEVKARRGSKYGFDYLMYTLPGEEWRVDAFL